MVRGSSIIVVYSCVSILSAFVLVFTFTWSHWINSLSRGRINRSLIHEEDLIPETTTVELSAAEEFVFET